MLRLSTCTSKPGLKSLMGSLQKILPQVPHAPNFDVTDAERANLAAALSHLNAAIDVGSGPILGIVVLSRATRSEVVSVGKRTFSTYVEAAVEMARTVAKAWSEPTYANQLKASSGALVFPYIPFQISNVCEELRAGLNLEEQKVAELVQERGPSVSTEPELPWEIEGENIQFRGDLRKLVGQSRVILRYLIRRLGREVTYEELGEEVWGHDFRHETTIHTAISRLKTRLVKLDCGDIVDGIRSVSGGYQFLFPPDP
jgi:hypothetical protein